MPWVACTNSILLQQTMLQKWMEMCIKIELTPKWVSRWRTLGNYHQTFKVGLERSWNTNRTKLQEGRALLGGRILGT
jgi:hypothetical protein